VGCSPKERVVNSIVTLQPVTAVTRPIDSPPGEDKLICNASRAFCRSAEELNAPNLSTG
jgi:hypothetical protein